jgi:hypothetical protein
MAARTQKPAAGSPSASAEATPPLSLIDRFFGLTAAGTSVATELRAGLATFLTMAYIMFVNPAILEKAAMDHGAVFVATCLAAAVSTLMGLYAHYPIALAPGGLNAYFAFTMVPELHGNWQLALSLTPLREWLINALPFNLKLRRRNRLVPRADRLAECGPGAIIFGVLAVTLAGSGSGLSPGMGRHRRRSPPPSSRWISPGPSSSASSPLC